MNIFKGTVFAEFLAEIEKQEDDDFLFNDPFQPAAVNEIVIGQISTEEFHFCQALCSLNLQRNLICSSCGQTLTDKCSNYCKRVRQLSRWIPVLGQILVEMITDRLQLEHQCFALRADRKIVQTKEEQAFTSDPENNEYVCPTD